VSETYEYSTGVECISRLDKLPGHPLRWRWTAERRGSYPDLIDTSDLILIDRICERPHAETAYLAAPIEQSAGCFDRLFRCFEPEKLARTRL
jgi:hypothetical protein